VQQTSVMSPMQSALYAWVFSGLVSLLALCEASPGCYDDWNVGPTVTLASGVLIGTTTSVPSATAGVNNFFGVPFADSPPERFSPPEDPKPWSQALSVTAYKPACIQQWTCKIPESFTKRRTSNSHRPPGDARISQKALEQPRWNSAC